MRVPIRLPLWIPTGIVLSVGVVSGCRSVSVEVGAVAATPQATVAPVPTFAPTMVPVSEQPLPLPTVGAPTAGLVPPTPHASFAPIAASVGNGSGEIFNVQQTDPYPFDAKQGQLLEVRFDQTAATLYGQLELVDPNGAVEVPWQVRDSGHTLSHQLAQTGTYSIRVGAYEGTGRYAITWALDRFGQLSSGDEVNSALSEAGQIDRYRFEATQGQVIRARLYRTLGVSLEPRLDLVDPSGTTESSVDGFGRPDITLQTRLASSGAYLLAVSGEKTGAYAVSLTVE